MSGQSHVPSATRKVLGYILTGNQFFNGFDSGAGFVKLPLYIAGATITVIYAPYILTGGFIIALIFLAKAIYDERQHNKKEQEKLKKLEEYEQNLLSIQARLEEDLKKKHGLDFITYYQMLAVKGASPAETTPAQLLKYLLRDYFEAFGDDFEQYRKPNGKFAKQNKILKLVQDVTKLKPDAPDFAKKMTEFFGEDDDLNKKFQQFFLKEENDSPIPAPKKGLWNTLKTKGKSVVDFFKKRTTLQVVGKRLINFLGDSATGAGIALGMMLLFGVIVAGTPVGLPLIGIIVASGLMFAGLSFAYQQFVNSKRKKNIKALDKELEEKKVKFEICERHVKTLENLPKKLATQPKIRQQQLVAEDDEFELEMRPVAQKQSQIKRANNNAKTAEFKVPRAIQARKVLGNVGRVISGIGLALIIALGIVWVASVLVVGLPYVLPALIVGGLLSSFYIYKAGIKTHSSENTKLQEVNDFKNKLFSSYDNDEISKSLLKTNQELLTEVINEYIDFVENKHFKDNGKLPKQEKIFELIEEVAGIKRETKDGKVLLVGNDKFYNELAKYLKGKSKNAAEANATSQRFKNLFPTGDDESLGITQAKVNADYKQISKVKNKLKAVGSFLKDHFFAFLGIVSISVLIPLSLLGPQALIVAAVGAVILTGFLIHKFASWRCDKNIEKLDQEKHKCALIERKYKLEAKNVRVPDHLQELSEEKVSDKSRDFARNHEKTMIQIALRASSPKPASKGDVSESPIVVPKSIKKKSPLSESADSLTYFKPSIEVLDENNSIESSIVISARA